MVEARVVLVTGGSRGIGLACARYFQSQGDQVAITYQTKAPEDLDGPSGTTPMLAISCDVTSIAEIDSAFSDVEAKFGPVSVLVCSAGITDDALLLRMGEERWDRVIATDLSSSFYTTKRALSPMIKARKGRIVLISSVVAYMGNAGQANYAAAKAGLIGFGRSLAREVASRSITVNVVAPGFIETDMTAALNDQQRQDLADRIPLQRFAGPDEVAAVVGFLASEQASYVTGAVVPVDGGLGMGH